MDCINIKLKKIYEFNLYFIHKGVFSSMNYQIDDGKWNIFTRYFYNECIKDSTASSLISSGIEKGKNYETITSLKENNTFKFYFYTQQELEKCKKYFEKLIKKFNLEKQIGRNELIEFK